MSALREIIEGFRRAAVTEREKGEYFEELVLCYLRNEATYRDYYSKVWKYADWAAEQGLDRRDVGIDLVAQTAGTNEFHAIQCKLYAEDHVVRKEDIDSFFTASGKKPFTHRIIVTTTNHWSEHAEDALRDQRIPVSKIDLFDLETSQIDWSKYKPHAQPVLKPRKQPRDHQQRAIADVLRGFETADRGKLIMACGTGKPFTSLKIAEQIAGPGGRVLFLVPSLALLSQTLTEWTQESQIPLHSFAVCSDSDGGKKRRKDDDTVQTFMHELRYPATTDAKRLALEMKKRHDATHMSVVFATYHSIEVIAEAQRLHGLPRFDLIVGDEAHRTTGATFEGEDESHFVKVHDGNFIRARKRLYMTATPRIFGDHAKATAERENITLASMDDEKLFGKEFHVLTFSESVRRGLLVDYKVIVLAVEESHVNRRLQRLLADENNELKVDDAAKIVGCWKALSKQGLAESLVGDEAPMRRAVAFCQVIELQKGAKTHKVSSKHIARMFQSVVDAYRESAEGEPVAQLRCEAAHIDGSMNASEKEEKLDWLREEPPEGVCRILSNVRCLSEGVDVPALDAVLFLAPRASQVDVVQSVGRVRRNAPGKRRGYVILPVVIPAGVEPHEALNDNKTYRVVWQVLQALRSHDDRFDAMINKLDLIGADVQKMEVIAITDKIVRRQRRAEGARNEDAGRGQYAIGATLSRQPSKPDQGELQFEIGEIERAIYAKIVQKCGNRHHWEDWANDIAKIARTHIDRISALLDNPKNTRARAAFDTFARELRDDLNDSITDAEIVEMLAQHLITKPVFDALFEDYSFASSNPISVAMQKMLDVLQEQHLEKEADTLEAFYESVRMRAEGIESAKGKQRIIVELYEKFFKHAFRRLADRLGIVYTPVEIVDFIIHSVAHVLETEFGETLGSRGVHILDPFTGTGTFIARLIQSGLISPKELPRKYREEIHANEIVLLAYYIAAVNIEAAYHGVVGGKYEPFEGICLTDTFQMYERDDLLAALMVDNSRRRERQRKLDIRGIIGNPPYSIGQESQNDNNQNVKYPQLDQRIAETYAARSTASNAKGLYDSYIRAIRWASDRVGDAGVIGFVTNANFLEATATDGLRRCLAEEFSDIYVFHLRGNARTSGEQRRKEKDNVFGIGSRAPVAISVLVKNPAARRPAKIRFHDIGDYLTREEKLERIRAFGSIRGITEANAWKEIVPDAHGDWLKQRDERFFEFIALGTKKGKESALFETFSLGVVTNRDAWCYNSSRKRLAENMNRMIRFFNAESRRFTKEHATSTREEKEAAVNDFITTDPTKISWTRGLKHQLVRGKTYEFDERCIVKSTYRPFSTQWLYFHRELNEMVLQIPRFFPRAGCENVLIGVSASESRSSWSVFITNQIPSLHAVDMVGSQFFPRYIYDDPEDDVDEPGGQRGLKFGPAGTGGGRRDGISDEGLAHFKAAYPGERISKDDIFYYVYGLLHSEDYRRRYADSLGKELPRIPCVKGAEAFWAFSRAGRALAKLHLNYESARPYPAKVESGGKTLKASDYRVEKMRFGKKGKEKDRTTIHYNERITITGVPLEAYEYVVNGKPAIEWVMERQGTRVDADSGIVNDTNDWAVETMKNPRYPLELLLRVVTVSLETMKIVRSLPPLEIQDAPLQKVTRRAPGAEPAPA